MRLPGSNIRRIVVFAVAAGCGLGLLTYGFARIVERNTPDSPPQSVLFALLSGVAIGVAFAVAIRIALRHVAQDLYAHAVDLTDAQLPEPLAGDGDNIVYLRRLLSQALASVPRAELFPQLAADLAAAADADAALSVALTYLDAHLPAHGAALLLLDHERSVLYPKAVAGGARLDENLTVDLYASAIGRALREQRAVMYSSTEARQLLPVQRSNLALSLYCLPLIVGDQPYGMFCVLLSGNEVHLNEEQRTYTRSIVDMLTLALQGAVYQQLFAREGDRLAAFEQLGNSIADSERIERALEQVLRVAARVTDSAHGTLLLLDSEEREVRVRITLKEGDVLPLSVTAAPILRHGLAGWALRERRADVIEDTDRDTRWLPVPGLDAMHSALVVPLLFGERTLGVLTLAHVSRRHYSRRSLALASALAAYAVTVLARSRPEDVIELGRHALTRRIFERHVSPELLDEVISAALSLEPRRSLAAIVCVGVRGLERNDDLAPQTLIGEVLQPFMHEVGSVFQEHGACVVSCGEGMLLGIFGYPLPQEAAMTQALHAAGAIRAVGRRLRKRWGAIGADLAISSGVAFDELVVGVLPESPGSMLNLFGVAIRDARRLQQLARPDEVLVGEFPGCDALDGTMLEALTPLQTPVSGDVRPLFRLLRVHVDRAQVDYLSDSRS